jgi:hypothetical protein
MSPQHQSKEVEGHYTKVGPAEGLRLCKLGFSADDPSPIGLWTHAYKLDNELC